MSHGLHLIAHIDGGSRGNPGPAAYGVIIETADGLPVASVSEFLGSATNNFAEYQALLAVLRYALKHGPAALEVVSDSELLVRQIQGTYKVRNSGLRPLYEEACRMIQQLPSFSIRHVLRQENREADRLANRAMDAGRSRSHKTPPGSNHQPSPDVLYASATFSGGQLKPDRDLPLNEGEMVDLEIRRRK